MNIFIANCTNQNQQINFRLPEARKPVAIMIPMGQQRPVGDLSPPEIEAMMEQLGPYGLISVAEIKRAPRKISYVYSENKPVTSEMIRMAHDKNQGVLRDEGKDRRKNAAVAANAGMNTEETPLNRLEMSVEEESSGTIPSEEPIGEGFKIDNTLDTSENKRPRPRSGGGRKN